jgi:hypothetical protein
MTELEVKKLKQINRFNEDVKIVKNIVILVIEPFLVDL